MCAFLRAEGREDDFTELLADSDAGYDVTDEIDLSALEPLIACPTSPGNVVPVREVAGTEVSHVVIGPRRPGLCDYAIAVVRPTARRHASPLTMTQRPGGGVD